MPRRKVPRLEAVTDAAPLHEEPARAALLRAKRKLSRRYLGTGGGPMGTSVRSLISTPSPADNVVGVGLGWQISGGHRTGQRALKVLVRRKFPENQIPEQERLPRSVDGIPVDVEAVGTIRASQINPRSPLRPAFPGCSIGWFDPNLPPMAGTFGALVRDDAGTYILSANHVIAGENELPVGAPVFQPGIFDGGNPATDRIAALERRVEMQAGRTLLDCAVARVIGPADPRIIGIGVPSGTLAAAQDMPVRKFGRSTFLTTGTVSQTDMDYRILYDRLGFVILENQIGIAGNGSTPFGDAGDSGALVLDAQSNAAVGLLVGNAAGITVVSHIDDVLAALSVRLVTA